MSAQPPIARMDYSISTESLSPEDLADFVLEDDGLYYMRDVVVAEELFLLDPIGYYDVFSEGYDVRRDRVEISFYVDFVAGTPGALFKIVDYQFLVTSIPTPIPPSCLLLATGIIGLVALREKGARPLEKQKLKSIFN